MNGLAACWTKMFPLRLARFFSPRRLHQLAYGIGQCAYFFVPRRRRAALENLRRFYGREKTERELKIIARHSSAALAMGVLENLRCRGAFEDAPPHAECFAACAETAAVLHEAKALHDRTGGCIFVTAHIGGYAILPYSFAAAGIPLTIPINPLRNQAMQNRWCPLNDQRALNGEMFVAKKNSLAALLSALDDCRSVGILADQRSAPGHAVDPRTTAVVTTRIPALLALQRSRPIVAGACQRNRSGERYRIKLCEPIWPIGGADKEAEILRLSQELDQRLAHLVRATPEQYLWMHNRWQPHRARVRASQRAGDKRGR